MRRVVVSLCILLAASSAEAGKKSPKTATLLSAIPASVSGAVALAGFVTVPCIAAVLALLVEFGLFFAAGLE